MEYPFLTNEDLQILKENGVRSREDDNFDPLPVVHLFLAAANMDWLLSEVDPDDPDLAYGLADLGEGAPEFGSIRLSELADLKSRFKTFVERDRGFVPQYTIGHYTDWAIDAGRMKLR